jgi:hypothetical protein
MSASLLGLTDRVVQYNTGLMQEPGSGALNQRRWQHSAPDLDARLADHIAESNAIAVPQRQVRCVMLLLARVTFVVGPAFTGAHFQGGLPKVLGGNARRYPCRLRSVLFNTTPGIGPMYASSTPSLSLLHSTLRVRPATEPVPQAYE